MSRKLALIIGNNDYTTNGLKSCVNDAKDLANALGSVNYKITLHTNLKSEDMYNRIKDFINSIQPLDFVIFFFSGHGVQWGDRNFLLPCDSDRISDGADMRRWGTDAQEKLDEMLENKPSTIVFLLDCCRDYWAPKHGKSFGKQSVGGLHQMKAPAGTVIVFACGAGETANDESSNDRNSVFTKSLLRHITTPAVDVEMIFRRVGNDVARETNNKQQPYRVSCINSDNVYIVPPDDCVFPLRSGRIDFNKTWSENGSTVAGGPMAGCGFNQLNLPVGVFVDEERTIYIADRYNDRIVQYQDKQDKHVTGDPVAGLNGKGNNDDQLSRVTDMIVDKRRSCLFICDAGNKRLVQWPLGSGTKKGKTIIKGLESLGITMDREGFLYASDFKNDSVVQIQLQADGTNILNVVAGGNGKGDAPHQLNGPTCIFVNYDGSAIYISDTWNNRVVKWVIGEPEGKVVAGGKNGCGRSPNQLSKPRGIVVDPSRSMIVADSGNHRIVRWNEGKEEGILIVGGYGKGSQPNQLSTPIGLSLNLDGDLYVVDSENHRVQKFKIEVSH